MSLYLSSWMLPLLVTLVAFVIAWWKSPRPEKSHDFMPDVFSMGATVIYFSAAGLVSLFAWFLWALFK